MATITIIGGGIIGMMSAYYLQRADKNLTIEIIDQQQVGQAASWAGGGIIAPLYPWHYNGMVNELARLSQEQYPKIFCELRSITGIDAEFLPQGIYIIDAETSAAALDWSVNNTSQFINLTQAQLQHKLTNINPKFSRALYFSDYGSVRNPRLLKALKAYLQAVGVKFIEHQKITGFELRDNTITALQTATKKIVADKFLLAAGASSGALLAALGCEHNLVYPVKGQILAFKTDRPLLDGVIIYNGNYLIPRKDNIILVGATVEKEFSTVAPTQDAYEFLQQTAYEILPELQQHQIYAHWAGLRPGSDADEPLIGNIDGFSNLVVASGHYRNGLLLAPATGQLVTDIILGKLQRSSGIVAKAGVALCS